VSTRDGKGKRLVRRPHPPPTATVLPDDFDAFTETRGSPTIMDAPHGADGSELDIDYDDMTVAPGLLMDIPRNTASASMKPAPTPLSPMHEPPHSPRRDRERERERRALPPPQSSRPEQYAYPSPRRRMTSPSRSLDQPGFDHVSGPSVRGKANSVIGAQSPRRTPRLSHRGPPPQGNLVQRKIIEDGPERTITIWREDVAASSGGGPADDEVRSEAGSHAGRKLPSSGGSGPPDAATPANGTTRHRDRLMRTSVDLAMQQSARSALHRSSSTASSPPQPQTPSSASPGPQPRSPRKVSQPSPPDALGPAPSLERMLASCDPPLTHLAPILAELGVRRDEHLRALARMRSDTRDREVREDALRKGVTVVEWAILIDRLRAL